MSADTEKALEVIELAQRDMPFCGCGRPTLVVGESGQLWLDCVAGHTPVRGGAAGRLLRRAGTASHLHKLLLAA